MGHPSLNNSTLFHTVYIPKSFEEAFNAKVTSYHISLREDYPEEELKKWKPSVLGSFKEMIWPYFDREASVAKEAADEKAKRLAAGRIKTHFGSEEILGEQYLEAPVEFAEAMIDEMERLLNTTGWKVEKKSKNLLVESKPISGPLAASGVLMTRCIGEINAAADKTFELLTSSKGYAVIDPISRPEDHDVPPLTCYPWKDGARLEAAIATTHIPMLPQGEFVVLNAIDPERMVFASKSILHKDAPGGSRYSNETPPESGRERALNTFGIKIEAISSNKCRISCINYADMAGKTTAWMNNLINTKLFFPPLYKRIAKAMEVN